MQIARGLPFVAVLACVAGSNLHAAPQQQLRAPKTASIHMTPVRLAPDAAKKVAVDLAEDTPEKMRVVEVPMLVIRLEAPQEQAEPAGPHGMSPACMKEMSGLERNSSRFGQSQQCEKKTGRSQQAIESLQKGDLSIAADLVEKTFHECAGLTSACAKQAAPEVVLKMRLSGLAISETCAKVAQDRQVPQDKANLECQDNATKGMVAALGHQDIDAAMSAAQSGLRTCQQVEAPCDFQLAPMLVVQLLQAQAEQQIQQVLLSGMHKAEEMRSKIELGEFSPVSTGKHHVIDTEAKQHILAKNAKAPEKSRKAVSLLSMNSILQVSSRRQSVMF